MNGHSAHPPARLAFRVLGPLEVDGPDGRPLDVSGGKPATVLTLLLLHRNAWVSTDQLIDAVWAGRDTPPSAQRNLKTYVWQLRRTLPDERIESRPGAYRVRVLPGELDADEAAGLADRAHKLLTTGTRTAATEAAKLVQRALGLWRGCPYDGLTGDASSAVDRLTELHRTLREDLADAQLALGRSAEAIALLRTLTDEDPLRELAWTRLMTALWQTGRRHDALAAYQRARGVLIRDLGIEPGAELTALHQQILTDEQSAEPPASTAHGTVRYSDLPPVVPGFVGRRAELAVVHAAVADRAADRVTVVGVEGMPGIGKTAFALVAAATIDGLEWRYHVDLRTHGSRPVTTDEALGLLLRAADPAALLPEAREARAALWRSQGRRVLLVVDDVADAAQVRELLPNAPGSVVVVTSRSRLSELDCDVVVTLDPLPSQDAEQLSDCEHVQRSAAGHPAALRQLADSLRHREPWTAARLAARLDDQAGRCRALAGVLARFDATYERLSPECRRFYRLISRTPEFDLRQAALVIGDRAEELIDELVDQYLVAEPAPGRFALHPLVRDHAHRRLLATESRAELELVAPDDPRVA